LERGVQVVYPVLGEVAAVNENLENLVAAIVYLGLEATVVGSCDNYEIAYA
jgi:hypothetical protein